MAINDHAPTLAAVPAPDSEEPVIDVAAAERARGVQKTGATTVTSALHGLFRDDPRTRQEFLALTTGRSS